MNVPSTSKRGYTILLIRILNNQTVSSGHVIKRAYESQFRGGSRGGGGGGGGGGEGVAHPARAPLKS
jgi:hypothetical protein